MLVQRLSLTLLVFVSFACRGGESGAPGGDTVGDSGEEGYPDSGAGDDTGLPQVGCKSLAAEPTDVLPDRVDFRTATHSFNVDYEVALLEGAIWVRPGSGGDWALLGETGRPEGDRLGNFGAPDEVVEISTDGVHLTAISDEGHFYRGSDMTTDVHEYFEWTDAWGGLLGAGAGLSTEFSTRCGWDVGDSHPFGVATYEDTNGTEHSVGMGVAHVYRLGEEGRRVFFNDWWLPEDWSRQICGPERGTFQALDLSVSASTMFLVGHQGELYTRLYDFDTGGENPLLTNSYVVGPDSGTTRKLPAEDWLRQPDITEGRITPRITIFRDGEGNAARVLRVEGVRDGRGGDFTKHIYDESWTFVETGALVAGPFLDESAAPDPVEPEEHAMAGTLSRDASAMEIDLVDLHMVCSPAEARLWWEGEVVTAGGEPLALSFHHVATWVEQTRPVEYWNEGIPIEVQAALLVPEDLSVVDDEAARAAVEDLLEDHAVINFLGTISPEGVSLAEITWDVPFRVPAEEKALLSPFALELAPR